MSKRLQVLVEEDEMREIQKAAEAQRVTVAEWVRTAMREARRHQPGMPMERKLATVRAAAKHRFPSADMEQMLAEIERGYLAGAEP